MNADLTKRAVVEIERMSWTPVAPGIDEKVLEDLLDRRTAVVRIAEGVGVPVGTDVLVLEGELQDEHSVYAAATYLHAPARLVSRGCVAFVKHRPAQATHRVVDLRNIEFEPAHTEGLTRAPLYADAHGEVVVLRFAPGTVIGSHWHRDGEEFVVLDGELHDEYGRYAPRCWVRQPAGSEHAVEAPRGCTMLTFAHHLAG